MDMVPVDRVEFGAMLFKSRVEGKSERQLAATHGISLREVQSLLDEYVPRLDLGRRRRAQALIIARLEALVEYWLPRALNDDIQAAALVLKMLERSSIAHGVEYGPQREVAPDALLEHRPSTSTERIRKIINNIVAERPPERERISQVVEAEPVETPAPAPVPSVHHIASMMRRIDPDEP